MTAQDIPAVRAIELASFSTTWQEEAFLTELKQNPAAHYLVLRAQPGGAPLGYAGIWLVEDEAHITSLALDPSCRGQGQGRRLLLSLLCKSRKLGARWATLEVRHDNHPAQGLYRRFGFVRVGQRRSYYQGQHDADILWAGNLMSRPYTERLRELALPWPEAQEEIDA